MTLTIIPGQPRKTLAGQLDRLEHMLGNLQETLQSVVSTAVEKAVTQAVQEALPTLLTALLTSPQFLNALHSHAATATSSAAPVRVIARHACRRLGRAGIRMWRPVRAGCTSWLERTAQYRRRLALAVKQLVRFKRRLLGACGMGLATSFIICWVGPWLGVMVGFVLGFLLTLAVQDRQRLRPLLAALVAEK